jgi:hypothetical protein
MRAMLSVCLACSLATLLLTVSAVTAGTPATWTPASLAGTVATGQSKQVTVSLTSADDLSNVSLRVVPELERFVSVSPATITSLPKGTVLRVTVTMSAPGDAQPGSYSGVLQLRHGNTIPKPLPITVSVCRCVSAKGASISYPAGWQLHGETLALNGPIALNNFANAYLQGGLVPSGGAEVDITTVPIPTIALGDFISAELVDATIEFTSTLSVGGEVGTRVAYSDQFTPSLTYKNVALYVPHRALLYKIYLSYRAGDAGEKSFLDAFTEVLNSVKFAP